MREREAGRERDKEISKPLEKGKNLISIVSTSLDAMSNLKQKNNHKEHKEIGRYHPFKGKNKSTESVPEKQQMVDLLDKDLK